MPHGVEKRGSKYAIVDKRTGKTKGTVKLGKVSGKVEVVMVRGRTPQNQGTPISNTVTLEK